jgi:hypothetical protein
VSEADADGTLDRRVIAINAVEVTLVRRRSPG